MLQTDTQTDKIGPILSSSGPVFWTVKTQIPVANASKTCPENNTPISLRNPVKGHLRLASVVALSSNGACGAIMGAAWATVVVLECDVFSSLFASS